MARPLGGGGGGIAIDRTGSSVLRVGDVVFGAVEGGSPGFVTTSSTFGVTLVSASLAPDAAADSDGVVDGCCCAGCDSSFLALDEASPAAGGPS